MIQKLFVLPLALVAAVSLAGPALACGDNASCTECKAETSAAPAGKVEHYGPPLGTPAPAPTGYLELKPKLNLGYPLGIDLKYKW